MDVSLYCDEAHRIETVTRSDDNFFPCFRTRNDSDADFLVFIFFTRVTLHVAPRLLNRLHKKKTRGSTDLAHVAFL